MNKGGGQYYPETVNTSPDSYSKSLYPTYQKIPDTLINPMKKRSAYFQQRLGNNIVLPGQNVNYSSNAHGHSKSEMRTLKQYDHQTELQKILHRETSVLQNPKLLQSDGFDMTRRNLQHPFHSSPLN